MTGLVDEAFESRRRERARLRREAIDRLVEESRRAGGVTDRLYWTMVHDFELAPLTTNLRQLAELGIEVPAATALDDDELSTRLWEIIEGLARLQIYLMGTDHLSDRELYSRLEGQVLREEVREVPPEPGVREYVDLSATRRDDDSCPIRSNGQGRTSRDARLPRPDAER